MKILFSFVGLVLGAIIDEATGAIFGLFIGLLAGSLIQYRDRLRDLEKQLAELRDKVTGESEEAVTPPTPATAEKTAAMPAAPARGEQKEPPEAERAEEEEEDITLTPLEGTGEHSILVDSEEVPTIKPSPVTEPPGGTTYNNPVTRFLRRFFTTGNVVVKVGILIVIIGVSFLLKLAAEQNLFPVELRFIAVALFAMGLFGFGWQLRESRRNYALVVQGGAVGILYITIYVATLKPFQLLPHGLAFGLMVGLVLFSCMLAVLQNARSLAVFAAAGGFLAPILTSTGEASHVILFSYYALLNAGIFAMAWYKSWRSLNCIGFLFTFVIGALWGYRYYQPQYFQTTEPFFVLFFLFYAAIPVLFAHRQPPRLKGIVDASLVFGTPLVAFTLQCALVRDFDYGESISALVLSSFYVLLARLLWHKRLEGMRMLTESFVALAVIFATLAIPFAVDGRLTAAAWSLEGAGIVWAGIRQRRMLPRLFGLLLQIGAAIAFLAEVDAARGGMPVLNSACIGMVLISLSALFTGWQFYQYRDRLHEAGRDAHIALLVWGLAWWFMAGLMEIDYHVIARFEKNAALFFIALSMWLLFICARALRWPAAEKVPVLLLPVMYGYAVLRFLQTPYLNPFAYFGYAGWIIAFVVQYGLLYRAETTWNKKLLGHWHALTLWLYIFMATWIIANAVTLYVSGLHGWNDVIWGLLPTIAVYKLLYLKDRFAWPIPRFRDSYLAEGMLPMIAYLVAWVVVNCFNRGDPSPVIYIPVINSQDIVQLLAMLAIVDWLLKTRKGEVPAISWLTFNRGVVAVGIIAFLWLNSLVAQALHFYADIPYTFDAMFDAELFQTSISIVWTLTALCLMVFATARGFRRFWFTGALLLAAVVVKLILIDLADSGTIARIVSFLSVGILMLIIGYYSPLPPREETHKKSA